MHDFGKKESRRTMRHTRHTQDGQGSCAVLPDASCWSIQL